MQKIKLVLLGVSIALMSFISSSLGVVACLDQNGNAVDWFVVYKLPLLETSGKKNIDGGMAQVYMDNKSGQWSMLDQPIDGKDHPVFYTLNQIYTSAQLKKQGGASDVMYVMYNDEIPEGNGSYPYEKGHTKGDICFDKSSGFWLVHSVPKFPPPSSKSYGYPSSGHLYGQSMLCVSLKYNDLNTIGKQLQYNYPQIYDYSLPVDFVADNAAMADAVKGVHIEDPPYNNRVVLTSLAGNQFISFAKSADFGEDLYDGFVAPSLGSDLLVETWMHGRDNNLPSNCSGQYTVKNIESLKILDTAFENKHDHAKWAATPKPSIWKQSADQPHWTCIGDINRQESQKKRGGGTVCTNIPAIWNAYSNIVQGVEECT